MLIRVCVVVFLVMCCLSCTGATGTVSHAKSAADGISVTIQDSIVTAVFDEAFYVSSQDRSCGLRVERKGHGMLCDMHVRATGYMRTDVNSERYLAASEVILLEPRSSIDSLATKANSLGGGDWKYAHNTGAGQCGLDGGHGLNNIGALVRISGKLTYRDAHTFDLGDDTGATVKCVTPANVIVDPRWQFAKVTGISSCEKTGSSVSVVLKVRGLMDIAVVQPDSLAHSISTGSTFTDNPSPAVLDQAWSSYGAVPGEPMTFGQTDVVGLFSDGAYNHITYRFDRSSNCADFIKVSFSARVYSCGYDAGEQPLALMYSFDGEYWFTSATLAAATANWETLSGSVTMGPRDEVLFVRFGGQTKAGGTAWYASVDKFELTCSTATVKNVMNYGAKGDGVTNDRAAIQVAINAASASGGTVYFPRGRYLVATSLLLKDKVGLEGDGPESVIIQGDAVTTLITPYRGTLAFCDNLFLKNLSFVAQGGASNSNSSFANFDHCRNVYVAHCSFDSSSQTGACGMFHQVDFTLCDGVVVVYNRFRNSLAATGMNGSTAEPALATNGYFARNEVEMYYDTGIGLWTGAHNTRIYANVFRGIIDDNTYAVGVDNDGAHDCIVDHNTFTGGQIGARIMDSHMGTYPINNYSLDSNLISGQKGNPNGNPACAVKIVHQLDAAHPTYAMDSQITNNWINCVSTGVMSWSYSPQSGGPALSLAMSGNEFTGNGDAVILGGYNNDGHYVMSNGTNTFNMSAGAIVGDPRPNEWTNPQGNPSIAFGDTNLFAAPVVVPTTYKTSTNIWSAYLAPGFYGVKLRYGNLVSYPGAVAAVGILTINTQVTPAQSNTGFDLLFAITQPGTYSVSYYPTTYGFRATVNSLSIYRVL